MQQINQQTPEIHDFSARPKIVNKKGKYREQNEEEQQDQKQMKLSNLMYDRRVIRGNTYASITLSKSTDPLLVEKHQQQQNEKSHKKDQKKQIKQKQLLQNKVQQTPPQEENKNDMAIQTIDYVEMLSDRLQEKDIEIQTDFYLDRPSNNRFKVKMEGQSVYTQIEKGDIFDFDEEVQPILGILCMKVIEQSRMEVLEEQELEIIKQQLKDYEQKIRAQRQEMQRLAEIESRKLQEYKRRNLQHKLYLETKQETNKKLMNKIQGKMMIGQIMKSEVVRIKEGGFFNSELNMISQYKEWLVQKVCDISRLNVSSDKELVLLQSKVKQTQLNSNQQAIQRQQLKKEQYFDKLEEDKVLKSERKEQRKIDKLKSQKQEERDAFRNELENYLRKAEKKDNIMAQQFTDIYYPNNTNEVIGVTGTILSEIVFTMGMLNSILLSEANNEVLNVLQTALKDNPKVFFETLEVFLEQQLFKEGSAVIPLTDNIDYFLQKALNKSDCTLENLEENLTADNFNQIVQILSSNIESIAYRHIVTNNVHSLSQDFIDKSIASFMKVALKSEIYQKKVKFVRQPPLNNYTNQYVLKMSPQEEVENQMTLNNNDNSQSVFVFEDKVTLFSHTFKDKNIILFQYVPTLTFRKQLIKAILNKFTKKFQQPKIEKIILPFINKKASKIFEDILEQNFIQEPQNLLEYPFIMEIDIQ